MSGSIRRELRRVLLLLAVFLLVNGLTLSLYPSGWVDEVQFADAAVSAASGQGFTSTAWFAQDSTQFWAGNVPLYTGMLTGWLKVFGPGLMAERSFNLVLFAVALLLLWRWMVWTELVRSARRRIAAVALVACGHAMVFSYRSGRYDVTGMLLMALMINCWDSPLALAALAVLLPAAGLQLIPATLVLCAVVVFVQGRSAWRRVAAVVGGMGVGCLALRGFYGWFGVWDRFVASTAAIGQAGESRWVKLAGLPAVYFADKSRVLLAIALIAMLVSSRRVMPKLARLALAALVVLPAALQLAGKFPIYYGWMVFIPLVMAVAHCAEGYAGSRLVLTPLLILAGVVGLPMRLACALAVYQEQMPGRVEQFVREIAPETAGRNPLVLADFKLYYALRERGMRPLLPTYFPALSHQERGRVTLLVIRPEDAARAEAQLGGAWQPTGDVLEPPAYHPLLRNLVRETREEAYSLAAYRRVRAASDSMRTDPGKGLVFARNGAAVGSPEALIAVPAAVLAQAGEHDQ